MAFDGCKPGSPRGRPLRVALFSGNYNYTLDGANKALNRLVDHLERAHGARVRVYSPTTANPAFEPKGELVSVPSLPIPLRREYRVALGLPPALRRDVEAFAPDVVHLSAPDVLGHDALKLARRLGAPAVASLHTLFETYLDYYALGWLRPAVEQRLNAFYSGCDFVLAPTRAIADELASGGLGDRARIWSRGVDRELFDPARRDLAWRRGLGFADDKPVIAFFGRLVMEKGLGVFADALAEVEARQGPTQILIIGEGPARTFLAQRLPRAVFTGFLTGPELGRAVASADVLVNPSRTETFCNVTLEAMASGLAVAAADAPNSRSLIRDGETGLLCSADDAPAFARAVIGLCDEPERRLALGRAARRASGDYTWTQILDAVVEVYQEALAAQPARDAA